MDISAYQHMNIRMSTRGKRPLRNLTPSDKVRAIQRIHNGETKASVSRDIGVPESTLRGWCKNEQKLRFMCRQLGSAADQLPMAHVVLDNPPEKRSKYDSGHHHHPKYAAASYEDFAYNRLALSTGVDFISANNNNTNTNNSSPGNVILEKIALNDFIKKTGGSLQADASGKQFAGGNSAHPLSAASAMMPMMSSDYNQQLSMIQNLSLLSLLNPNLAAIGANAAGCATSNENHCKSPKAPLRATNTLVTDAASDSGKGGGILSVKNWAKDPTENNNNNNSSSKRNDTNNNDVKQKPSSGSVLPLLPALPLSDAANFSTLFPGDFTQLPQPSADADGNNASLLDWYKIFNVSLNFFALATAAAALQAPQTSGPDAVTTPSTGDENALSRAESDAHPADTDNILYKQLTKMAAARTFNSPTTTSEMSNDSYFDSEPEDLSVRSTTSKVSSAPNSRSQSPAKSIASASAASSSSAQHSDAEQ